jgi:predicted nucleic acid-binding protein
MIADTEFLISLRGQEEAALELASTFEVRNLPIRVPTAAVQQIFVGVAFGENSFENVRDYESLLANKPVVPLTDNIARKAGVLEGDHEASDRKPALGMADSIIAATGLVYNEAIVTNDGDFEDVDGLQVELY